MNRFIQPMGKLIRNLLLAVATSTILIVQQASAVSNSVAIQVAGEQQVVTVDSSGALTTTPTFGSLLTPVTSSSDIRISFGLDASGTMSTIGALGVMVRDGRGREIHALLDQVEVASDGSVTVPNGATVMIYGRDSIGTAVLASATSGNGIGNMVMAQGGEMVVNLNGLRDKIKTKIPELDVDPTGHYQYRIFVSKNIKIAYDNPGDSTLSGFPEIAVSDMEDAFSVASTPTMGAFLTDSSGTATVWDTEMGGYLLSGEVKINPHLSPMAPTAGWTTLTTTPGATAMINHGFTLDTGLDCHNQVKLTVNGITRTLSVDENGISTGIPSYTGVTENSDISATFNLGVIGSPDDLRYYGGVGGPVEIGVKLVDEVNNREIHAVLTDVKVFTDTDGTTSVEVDSTDNILYVFGAGAVTDSAGTAVVMASFNNNVEEIFTATPGGEVTVSFNRLRDKIKQRIPGLIVNPAGYYTYQIIIDEPLKLGYYEDNTVKTFPLVDATGTSSSSLHVIPQNSTDTMAIFQYDGVGQTINSTQLGMLGEGYLIQGRFSINGATNPGGLPSLENEISGLTKGANISDGYFLGTNSCGGVIPAHSVAVANNAPVANAGNDQSVIHMSTVALDGTGSSDPDDDTLTYSWTVPQKPDGSAVTITAPNTDSASFTADATGTYVLELMVTDEKNATDTDSVTVTVTTAPAPAPSIQKISFGTNVNNSHWVAAPGTEFGINSGNGIFVAPSASQGDASTTAAYSYTSGESTMHGTSLGYGAMLVQFKGDDMGVDLGGITSNPVTNTNTTIFGSASGPFNENNIDLAGAGIDSNTSVTIEVDMNGLPPHMVMVMGGSYPEVDYDSTAFGGDGKLTISSTTAGFTNNASETFNSAFGFSIMTASQFGSTPMGIIAQTDHWVGDIFPYLPGLGSSNAANGSSAGSLGNSAARSGISIAGLSGDSGAVNLFVPQTTASAIFGGSPVATELAAYEERTNFGPEQQTESVTDDTNFNVPGYHVGFDYTFNSPVTTYISSATPSIAPVITSTNPSTINVSETTDTLITINGSNLDGVTQVTLDGVNLFNISSHSSSVDATIPSAFATGRNTGNYELIVETEDGSDSLSVAVNISTAPVGDDKIHFATTGGQAIPPSYEGSEGDVVTVEVVRENADPSNAATAEVRVWAMYHTGMADLNDFEVYDSNSQKVTQTEYECMTFGEGTAMVECGDYYTVSLNWAAGEDGTETFSVALLNDGTDTDAYGITEYPEMIPVELRNVTGATKEMPDFADIKILSNNDLGSIQFQDATDSGSEGETIQIAVTRTGDSSQPLDAWIYDLWNDECGQWPRPQNMTEACSWDDFRLDWSTTNLHWDASDSSTKYISIELVADDEGENDETFTLVLDTFATKGDNNEITVTIGSSVAKSAGSVAFATQSMVAQEYMSDGQGGYTDNEYVVTLNRSGGTDGELKAYVETLWDGTAWAYDDYEPVNWQEITFANGDTTATFNVKILLDDDQAEGSEEIPLRLTCWDCDPYVDESATITIQDATDTQFRKAATVNLLTDWWPRDPDNPGTCYQDSNNNGGIDGSDTVAAGQYYDRWMCEGDGYQLGGTWVNNLWQDAQAEFAKFPGMDLMIPIDIDTEGFILMNDRNDQNADGYYTVVVEKQDASGSWIDITGNTPDAEVFIDLTMGAGLEYLADTPTGSSTFTVNTVNDLVGTSWQFNENPDDTVMFLDASDGTVHYQAQFEATQGTVALQSATDPANESGIARILLTVTSTTDPYLIIGEVEYFYLQDPVLPGYKTILLQNSSDTLLLWEFDEEGSNVARKGGKIEVRQQWFDLSLNGSDSGVEGSYRMTVQLVGMDGSDTGAPATALFSVSSESFGGGVPTTCSQEGTRTLTGHVKDSNGAAIADLGINIESDSGMTFTKSKGDGSFEASVCVDNGPNARLEVMACYYDFTKFKDVCLDDGFKDGWFKDPDGDATGTVGEYWDATLIDLNTTTDVTVVLGSGAQIWGKAIGGGQGVQSVRVEALPWGGHANFSNAKTDSNGEFKLNLSPGTESDPAIYKIEFQTSYWDDDANNGAGGNVTVQGGYKGGFIKGDHRLESGVSTPGSLVEDWKAAELHVWTDTSDTDQFDFRIHRANGTLKPSTGPLISKQWKNFNYNLGTANSISGTIFVDADGDGVADDGEGIQGIMVEAMPEWQWGYSTSGGSWASAKTDKNGNYTLLLEEGLYRIELRTTYWDDQLRQEVQVSGGVMGGVVVDDSVTTDDNYTVTGDWWNGKYFEVTTSQIVNVPLSKGITITGAVYDDTMQAPTGKNLEVQARSSDWMEWHWGKVDSNGQFSIPVKNGKNYVVEIMPGWDETTGFWDESVTGGNFIVHPDLLNSSNPLFEDGYDIEGDWNVVPVIKASTYKTRSNESVGNALDYNYAQLASTMGIQDGNTLETATNLAVDGSDTPIPGLVLGVWDDHIVTQIEMDDSVSVFMLLPGEAPPKYGRLRDGSNPLSKAWIGAEVANTETDSNGCFELKMPDDAITKQAMSEGFGLDVWPGWDGTCYVDVNSNGSFDTSDTNITWGGGSDWDNWYEDGCLNNAGNSWDGPSEFMGGVVTKLSDDSYSLSGNWDQRFRFNANGADNWPVSDIGSCGDTNHTGLDIVVDNGTTIQGHVFVDTNGDGSLGAGETAIRYAWVDAWNQQNWSGFGTDSKQDGSFTLQLQDGEYELNVWAQEYPPIEPMKLVVAGSTVRLNGATLDASDSNPYLPIGLEAGKTISGRVLDSSGNPVTDMWVDIHTRSCMQWWDQSAQNNCHWSGTATDENGLFSAPVKSASDYIAVIWGWDNQGRQAYETQFYNGKSNEWEADLIDVSSSSQEDVNFTMDSGKSISGYFTGLGSGERVWVDVWSEKTMSWGGVEVTGDSNTDTSDTFTIAGLKSAKDYRLSWWADSYESGSYGGTAGGAAVTTAVDWMKATKLSTKKADVTGVGIALSAGAAITVDISGLTAGTDVNVDAWSDTAMRGGWGWGQADVNGNLSVTLPGLSSSVSDYKVFVNNWQGNFKNGYYYCSGTCDSGSRGSLVGWDRATKVAATGQTLYLQPSTGGKITGTVSGVPSGKFGWINAWSESTYNWGGAEITGQGTDVAVNYEIKGLGAASDYRVDIWVDGMAGGFYQSGSSEPGSWDQASKVSVTDGATTSDIDFTMSSGRSISGAVKGLSSGEDAWMDAWSNTTFQWAGGSTGASTGSGSDSYTIEGLKSASDYEVTLWSPGYVTQSQQNVDVSSGNATGVDFTVGTGAKLKGSITAGSKYANKWFWIDAYSNATGAWGGVGESTDASGTISTYTIEGLGNATDYVVAAWAPDGTGFFYKEDGSGNPTTSVTDWESATKVTISAGADVTGKDLDFSSVTTYGLSGTVSGLTGDDADKTVDVYVWSNSGGGGWDSITGNGTWNVSGLSDGTTYNVEVVPQGIPGQRLKTASVGSGTAACSDSSLTTQSSCEAVNSVWGKDATGTEWTQGWKDLSGVTLSGSGVKGLDLAMTSGVTASYTISGTVCTSTSSDSTDSCSGDDAVTVQPWVNAWDESNGIGNGASAASDGSYTIEDLPDGTYQVEVWTPQGSINRSVTISGSNQSADLQIVVGLQSISGSVTGTNADGALIFVYECTAGGTTTAGGSGSTTGGTCDNATLFADTVADTSATPNYSISNLGSDTHYRVDIYNSGSDFSGKDRSFVFKSSASNSGDISY